MLESSAYSLIELHMIAFLLGFVLDLLLGDPHFMPHPVKLMGRGIAFFDKKWNVCSDEEKLKKGKWLVGIMLFLTAVVSFFLLFMSYYINTIVGVAVEAVMTYQVIALKSLKTESMKVYKALDSGDVEKARYAVSMIVGRDTSVLDEEGIAKAAVETVAENTSDGVVAPLIYTAILGPVGGMLYKCINTCDSMIGYKSEKYLYFGRTAAKLDDVVNFLPARISAFLMIFASFFLGKEFSTKDAYRIYKRDRFCHASPNSAQTESVVAGALGLKLAGNAVYFGKLVEKPTIGDEKRSIEAKDIVRANQLLYMTSVILMLILMLVLYEITKFV